MKWRFLFILLAAGTAPSWCQNEYYIPENILRFAGHLYDTGDYLRAAGEYQRYGFIRPDSLYNSDSLLYRIGLCYRKGGKPETALHFYETYLHNYPAGRISDESRYQIASIFFETGRNDTSIAYINRQLSNLGSESAILKMQKLTGLNYLMQRRWEEAYQHVTSLAGSPYGLKDEQLPILKSYAERGLWLPKKSPLKAGIFSAIIPGTGKIYTGRKWDGLFSLFSIGLFGLQAWDGFYRDGRDSVKGWVYGSFGGIFYLGNIYGSVIAARIHNREIEDRLVNQIKVELRL